MLLNAITPKYKKTNHVIKTMYYHVQHKQIRNFWSEVT